jgi:hypothetical protein
MHAVSLLSLLCFSTHGGSSFSVRWAWTSSHELERHTSLIRHGTPGGPEAIPFSDDWAHEGVLKHQLNDILKRKQGEEKKTRRKKENKAKKRKQGEEKKTRRRKEKRKTL